MTICKACEDGRHEECTVVCKDAKVCECYAETEQITKTHGSELLIE